MLENIYSMLQARWHYLCETSHSDFFDQLLCFFIVSSIGAGRSESVFYLCKNNIIYKGIKIRFSG